MADGIKYDKVQSCRPADLFSYAQLTQGAHFFINKTLFNVNCHQLYKLEAQSQTHTYTRMHAHAHSEKSEKVKALSITTVYQQPVRKKCKAKTNNIII